MLYWHIPTMFHNLYEVVMKQQKVLKSEDFGLGMLVDIEVRHKVWSEISLDKVDI
jgi:hypothetical protein